MPDVRQLLAALEDDTDPSVGAAFARLVSEYFLDTRTGAGPVSTPLSPADLARRFDEPLPLEGRPIGEVLARIEREVLPDCNRLMHPRSMGHQVSAPLPASVWTESLTAALNQSGAVWEMSPVGTVVEAQVIRWMCRLAGFGADAGGTFTSGGTEANFAGLLAARQAAMPQAWTKGIGPTPPAVVCGEHAHYSVARAVGLLGLGTDHVVTVPSGEGLTMDPAALGRVLDGLDAGQRPVMAVVATAGSTATGSFDDLEAIGSACERRGIWLHVDGSHGASALLSERHRAHLSGIERASSLAWDPHKMMLMPLTASVVLARREGDLERAFSQSAPYLFHGREGRNWDQGLRSFTCSRRIDALKVWVALQRYGAAGLGALYDRLCDTCSALHALVQEHPAFSALHVPTSNILCFRYVGDRAGDAPALDDLNLRLRTAYNRGGEGWITTTLLHGRRVLRVTIMNPRTGPDDLRRLLDGLSRTAALLH
ncbi:MAG: Pyridoxal-dependent decarboxylase [Acidobacteria bacterium]|nr:Pyridoxal-dependent decarboxylase [Acidobacteriota bacterium]